MQSAIIRDFRAGAKIHHEATKNTKKSNKQPRIGVETQCSTSPLAGEVGAHGAPGGDGAARRRRLRPHPLPNLSPVKGEGLKRATLSFDAGPEKDLLFFVFFVNLRVLRVDALA